MTISMHTKDARIKRAHYALEGLSVGDAFGEQFFVPEEKRSRLFSSRDLPDGPWPYTDDTNMALSVYEILQRYDAINADALAQSFAHHYDWNRGYGPGMHRILAAIRGGEPWDVVAQAQFAGQGSYGNGAAMRAAPLGAFFADDLTMVVAEANLAARITHAHPEGIAGGIAVAVASALAWQHGQTKQKPTFEAFLSDILVHVPPSTVAGRIQKARTLGPKASHTFAVSVLGNGHQLSAQDTVPYCLWCAAKSLDDYEEALWLTVRGLGDRDTTCAIVGGIVASYTGFDGIPTSWRSAREPLPDWPFA